MKIYSYAVPEQVRKTVVVLHVQKRKKTDLSGLECDCSVPIVRLWFWQVVHSVRNLRLERKKKSNRDRSIYPRILVVLLLTITAADDTNARHMFTNYWLYAKWHARRFFFFYISNTITRRKTIARTQNVRTQ